MAVVARDSSSMQESTYRCYPQRPGAVNRLDRAGRESHGEDIVVLGPAERLPTRTTHLPNELALKMDGA